MMLHLISKIYLPVVYNLAQGQFGKLGKIFHFQPFWTCTLHRSILGSGPTILKAGPGYNHGFSGILKK